jgi:hypothetical protein
MTLCVTGHSNHPGLRETAKCASGIDQTASSVGWGGRPTPERPQLPPRWLADARAPRAVAQAVTMRTMSTISRALDREAGDRNCLSTAENGALHRFGGRRGVSQMWIGPPEARRTLAQLTSPIGIPLTCTTYICTCIRFPTNRPKPGLGLRPQSKDGQLHRSSHASRHGPGCFPHSRSGSTVRCWVEKGFFNMISRRTEKCRLLGELIASLG